MSGGKGRVQQEGRGGRRPHAFFWSLVLLGITLLLFRAASQFFRVGMRPPGFVLSLLGLLCLFTEIVVFLPVLYRNAFGETSAAGRFKVTTGGWVFILLIILMGLAAINTGNNLLYVLLSFLIAAIVVSGTVSRVSLRKINISIDFPETVFAGDKTVGRFSAANEKRFNTSYSLGVECRLVDETFRQALAPGLDPGSRSAQKKMARLGVPFVTNRMYASAITARQNAAWSFPVLFLHRGLYRILSIELGTSFPFGFFRKTRLLEGRGELVVYPRPADADTLHQVFDERMDDEPLKRKGPGSEILALRDYRRGEDIRLIHWKVSARMGKLITREFALDGKERLRILLDQVVSGGAPRRQTKGGEAAPGPFPPDFEKALSALTSLTLEAKQEGTTLEVVFSHPGEGEPRTESDDAAILRRLALLHAVAATPSEGEHPFNVPGFLNAIGFESQERFILVSERPPEYFGELAGIIDFHLDSGAP